MAIAGAALLMVRYKAINLKLAENWEEEYMRSTPQSGHSVAEKSATEMVEDEQAVEEVKTPRPKRAVKSESTLQRKAKEKIAARKAVKESASRTIREKKTS